MKVDSVCQALVKMIADGWNSYGTTCEMRLRKVNSDGKDWHWVELEIGGRRNDTDEYELTECSMPMSRTRSGAKRQFLKSYCGRYRIGSIEELVMVLIAKGYMI